MSDHGARPMIGGVCFNDWLQQEGFLALSSALDGAHPHRQGAHRLVKTLAWGDGGYYGRLFLNVKGREPQGVIEPGDYEAVRDELIQKLEAMTDHDGEPMGTSSTSPRTSTPRSRRGPRPHRVLRRPRVALGGHHRDGLRSTPSRTTRAPTAPTTRSTGVFAMAGAPGPDHRADEGLRLIDVGPTIMKLYGLEAPEDITGRSML